MHFDHPAFDWYYRLRSGLATTKYAHYLDKGILPIVVNDLTEAKATMQRLQYNKLPGAVAGIFDSLSFLVITKDTIDTGKATTFMKDTWDLWPPNAAYSMIQEGFDIETKDGLRMDKLGYLVAG